MTIRSHTRRASATVLELEEDESRSNISEMQADLARTIVQSLSKPCPKPSPSSGQADRTAANGSSSTSPQDEEGLFTFTKSIPTMVLYDEKGLSLYSEITEEPDYYPFETERELLVRHGEDIARRMFSFLRSGAGDQQQSPHNQTPHPQSIKDTSQWGDYETGVHNHGVNGALGDDSPRGLIVELGAGNLKKTGVLLDQVTKLVKGHYGDKRPQVEYYAVDLEKEELITTLDDLVDAQPEAVSGEEPKDHRTRVSGINASYDLLRPYLAPEAGIFPANAPKSFMQLGSSIGNEDFPGAIQFLKNFSDSMNVGDTFLIGIDSTRSKAEVELAYGDRHHITEAFILNGLAAVRRLLEAAGYSEAQAFSPEAFEYVHRFNPADGCHEAYVRSKNDITSNGKFGSFHIHQGELLRIERSFKFDAAQIAQLWDASGLRVVNSWHHDKYDYGLYLLEKPAFHFQSTQLQISRGINPFGVPSLEDWQQIWKAWDTVTVGMIPENMLHVKPIDLRHKNLFYLGHIPAFLQIHLSNHFKEPFTEPASYATLFERGIDPQVDDPTQCHDHSEVPDREVDWPTLQEVTDYRDRVRDRLAQVYTSGRLDRESKSSRRLARVLGMVFEHEAMHLETLLYMLAQVGDKINPPPGFIEPDWQALKASWDRQVSMEAKSPSTVDYPGSILKMGHDDSDIQDGDIPLTPEQRFGWDNENGVRDVKVPAFKISSLPVSNGDYMSFMKQHKLFADSSMVPTSWKQLPSGEYGVRVVYPPGHVSFDVACHWPVQASYDQLNAYAKSKNARLPTEPELRTFLNDNLQDRPVANRGFRNWHPVPPRAPKPGQAASNGGVWEWTSSDFGTYEGYTPSLLYPGYSSDFFDGTHNVIIGGSWATVPRISGRPTFRNWFQKNYPYVFCGGRLVYDS